MKLIDLSVEVIHDTPCDPPSMPTKIKYMRHREGTEHMLGFFPNASKEDLPGGLGWALEYVNLTTHSGTHMDAPWHFHPTMNQGEPARTIEQMPLEYGFSDGVVLDFSHFEDGRKIERDDIDKELERIQYRIKPLDIVLIRSGADKFWGTKAYLTRGCGMGRESTLYLLEKGVKVVGTDAWSWDRPLVYMADEFAKSGNKNVIWEGHFAGIEKEYYQMEKLTNLDQLPSHGFRVACFPVKVKGASAGWVRAVAIVEE